MPHLPHKTHGICLEASGKTRGSRPWFYYVRKKKKTSVLGRVANKVHVSYCQPGLQPAATAVFLIVVPLYGANLPQSSRVIDLFQYIPRLNRQNRRHGQQKDLPPIGYNSPVFVIRYTSQVRFHNGWVVGGYSSCKGTNRWIQYGPAGQEHRDGQITGKDIDQQSGATNVDALGFLGRLYQFVNGGRFDQDRD